MNVPTMRLWREDIAVKMVSLPGFTGLAEAAADDNCSGESIAPLESSVPGYLAGRRAYISSVTDGRITSPRCHLLTREGELVLDALETTRTRDRAFEEYSDAVKGFKAESGGELSRVALIGSQRMNAYWHWWVDVVPRIWMIDTYGGSELAGLPLALPPLRPFQQQTIDLLGYTERVITLKRGLHRFPTVIFTPGITGTYPQYPSALVSDFSKWLRDRTLSASPSVRPERLGRAPRGDDHRADPRLRIFVGRRDARRPKRLILNEEEVREHLTGHGFTCIDASQLSIREQASLFSRADVVAGPHGAGLTNLLFCRPGTQVVEIFPASGARPLSCFRLVASHLGLPYTRMVVPTADGPRFGCSEKQQALNDNMIVDIRALERRLDLMFA